MIVLRKKARYNPTNLKNYYGEVTMKFVKIYFFILVGLSLFVTSSIAEARGLIGERYGYVGFGLIKPGDDFLDKTITVIGGGVNVPLAEKVDLTASLARANIDEAFFEETDDTLAVGATLYSKEEENILFVNFSLLRVKADYSIVGFPSGSDSDTGYALGFGLERDLGENLSLTPSLTYQDVFDSDDIALSCTLHRWFNEKFGGFGELAYYTDDGDLGFFAGVNISF